MMKVLKDVISVKKWMVEMATYVMIDNYKTVQNTI